MVERATWLASGTPRAAFLVADAHEPPFEQSAFTAVL
jgi:hypothetical protein